MKNLVSFIVGTLFALGLGLSGMTQTHIVKGFLDIFGNWNPTLLGVMIGAIAVHAFLFHIKIKRVNPKLEIAHQLPTNQQIDSRLIIGSALFGLGWGWAGICPGPGIVGLMSGNTHFLIFIVSMLTGMFIFKLIQKKFL